MSRTDTAAPRVATAHGEAVGMGLGMAVIAAGAVIFFPVTLVVIAVVRSQEIVPRLIQAIARRLPTRGAR